MAAAAAGGARWEYKKDWIGLNKTAVAEAAAAAAKTAVLEAAETDTAAEAAEEAIAGTSKNSGGIGSCAHQLQRQRQQRWSLEAGRGPAG